MRQEKQRRTENHIRSIIIVLGVIGGGLAFIYHYLLSDFSDLFITPSVRGAYIISLGLAVLIILVSAVFWSITHGIHKGFAHALVHSDLISVVEDALFEAGFYIIENNGLARLPKIKLHLNNDRTQGIISVQNHLKHDKSLDNVNISSALGNFIVDQQYLSDNQNEYTFEISDSRAQKQMVFDSANEFTKYSKQNCNDYELFIDETSKIKLHHLLLVGQTGSGKTYALYSLILQMLAKRIPYHLYFADPKMSSLSKVGEKVSKENTAEDTDSIIDLLRRFNNEMEKRKKEIKERLSEQLDADYTTFGLAPHVLIFDEYASFQAIVSTMDKKTRDEVSALLKAVVMQGRQLGFFLVIVAQKSDATTISTDIRDNLVGKFVLGQSEKTTYETCFGASGGANVPNRKYSAGQGVFTYSGLTHQGKPKLCYFPTLRFDVLGAIHGLLEQAGEM